MSNAPRVAKDEWSDDSSDDVQLNQEAEAEAEDEEEEREQEQEQEEILEVHRRPPSTFSAEYAILKSREHSQTHHRPRQPRPIPRMYPKNHRP